MVLLVRFGELALKSPYVRRQLRDHLVGNIQEMFASDRIECLIRADRARIYVEVNDVAGAIRSLRRVFGIVSVSDAREAGSDPEEIAKHAVDIARAQIPKGGSFAIRPRRSGHHLYTSQDLAKLVGRRVQDAVGARVDLGDPNLEIHIEVRDNRSYLFTDIVAGSGGLPMGSQGRALAVVDSEAGTVAAWLAMKRGCKITVAARNGSTAHEPLLRWDLRLKVLSWSPDADLQELVRLSRSEALILGTRTGALDAAKPILDVPVFHPVVGLDEAELTSLAERIRSG